MSFAASVPAHVRGVHMSRFVESLHDWHSRLGVPTLSRSSLDLSERLEADDVVRRFEFPLFLERSAPVTVAGLHSSDTTARSRGDWLGGRIRCTLTVRVPDHEPLPLQSRDQRLRSAQPTGSHRGRCQCFVVGSKAQPLDFSDLIEITEEAGSAPIYSLLKRTDERYVTMQAYENPAFVEDIARAVAAALKAGLENSCRGECAW